MARGLPALALKDKDGGPGELPAAAQAWADVTECIPADRLWDCYRYAVQNRTGQYPLNAEEMVQAWRRMQDANEGRGSKFDKSRALPAMTGDLTPDEIAERQAEFAKLRATLSGRMDMNAPRPRPTLVQPKSLAFQCDTCKYVSTLPGWQHGDACTAKGCAGGVMKEING